MNKFYYLFFFILFFANRSDAQQMPLLSQYQDYNGYFNPASVNTDYFIEQNSYFSVGGLYKQKWIKSTVFRIHTGLVRTEWFKEYDNINILFGGYGIVDKVGALTDTGLSGRFACYIGDTNKRFVGLGFNLSYLNHVVDYTDFKSFQQENYDFLRLSDFSFDLGAGIFGVNNFNKDLYIYFGVSSPQLLFYSKRLEFVQEEFNYNRIKHFFGILGLFKSFDDGIFVKFHSTLEKVPFLPFRISGNFTYNFKQQLHIGLGGDSLGTVHLELGVPIAKEEKLKIVFGLDIIFNQNYGAYTNPSLDLNIPYFSTKY